MLVHIILVILICIIGDKHSGASALKYFNIGQMRKGVVGNETGINI